MFHSGDKCKVCGHLVIFHVKQKSTNFQKQFHEYADLKYCWHVNGNYNKCLCLRFTDNLKYLEMKYDESLK